MLFVKFISCIILFLMGLLALKPLYFAIFYNFFRPIVQPWAIQHYTLFPGGQITGLFAIAFIFVTVISVVFRRGYSILPPNIIPLYLLVYFSSCSFLNSINYTVSIAHVLKILTGISMYLLTYNAIKSIGDAKKVLWGLQISTIIPMLYGYYQYVAGTGSAYVTGMAANRVGSFFHQPNAFGEFMCINLCAGLILFLQEKTRWKKYVLLIIMGSMLLSLLLSLHRGSWIAFTAALIIAYPPFFRKIKIRWYLIPGSFIAIIGAPIIISRFNQLAQTNPWGQSRNTFIGRVEFWKKILGLVPDHPFIGHGIGTSDLITGKLFGIQVIPHNDYIRLLFEIGLPGLLLYILFLSREWFYNLAGAINLQQWYISYPMLICITYWIILSMTQNMIFSVSIFPIFMMLLGTSKKWVSIANTNP